MMKEIELIIAWLQKECPSRIAKGLIVGISGGIDSAVTSTLCAMTGLPVHVMTMPIFEVGKNNELAELFNKQGSDKFKHGYSDIYFLYLEKLKTKNINLLEIMFLMQY